MALGTISEAVLTETARRILRTMDRFGLLANASPTGGRVVERERPTLDVLGSAQVAREVATKGAVLLKNRGALPLGPADLRSIVVIGPSARHSSSGAPAARASSGSRSERRASSTRSGSWPVPARRSRSCRASTSMGSPCRRRRSPRPTAAPASCARTRARERRRSTPGVDFVGDRALAPGSRLTWTGWITIPADGEYELKVQTDWGVGPFLFNPGGHSVVYVDGREVASTAPFESRTLSLIPTSSGLTTARAAYSSRRAGTRSV